MTRRRFASQAPALLFVLLIPLVALAGGSYGLDWWTTDGGGGASSGGGFDLVGSIGQAEAGALGGGGYTLGGGFWGAGTAAGAEQQVYLPAVTR